MTRTGLFKVLGMALLACAVPLHAENIGVAHEEKPNARSVALTRLFMTMIGDWKGSYTYFDEAQGKYVTGNGTLQFRTTPMPNVITLDAMTERPGGKPPVHAFSTMVVQADGVNWRQMAFTETGGRIQDKVITDYHIDDDRNWTVDLVEVQQGLGVVSAVVVKMVVKNGHLDMRKFRKFEGGAAAARDYESLASFDKAANR